MGLHLYLCEVCNEPKTEYCGESIKNCINQCYSWACYNCVNNEDLARRIYYDWIVDDIVREEKPICEVCKKKNEIKNCISELKCAINKLLIQKRISKIRISQINKLIDDLECAK
jgi:hypothetical protein